MQLEIYELPSLLCNLCPHHSGFIAEPIFIYAIYLSIVLDIMIDWLIAINHVINTSFSCIFLKKKRNINSRLNKTN